MFVEYIWREKNSASLDGCVLTSLKHRVNFYMLHVIDFPTGCGKKPRLERETGKNLGTLNQMK